jgi:galactofuranosylgalactofuranosylrhamnosyl-N-acetylglucosaminyl-diphospho-decaprenol beta-1,5/1,6-galactofuranosyltransferase
VANAENGGPTLRVVQRVVFPGEDLDVVPLYVETDLDRGAAELAAEMATEALTGFKSTAPSVPVSNTSVGQARSIIRFGADVPAYLADEAGPRRSAIVTEGRRVSFSTYFNAFPASYWRRWTTVDAVTLRIRLAGESTLILYRSSARGHSHPVETINVDSDLPVTIERTLPLKPFIDGGWYWFDIVAGRSPVTLVSAEWLVESEAGHTGRASIGITTFNRASFLIDLLRTIGDAPELVAALDTVYVIDQGTSKVSHHPSFPEAAKKLPDQLTVIEQGNIGGSGGFSRSMDEAVQAGRSDYLLLLDDDINLEPEGVLRAIAFADLARRPTIVGGHMFSLYDRSMLHAFAEAIAPLRWWWGTAPNTRSRHDFGRRNLRNTPWLHRRAEADYNGWWMCMIPVKVISELGLAIPAFLKWDDAEYGVRAKEHGIATVSLPGAAAWHVPWMDKNDALDWQSYYHLRNRIISALLHSPEKRGGKLISESGERQLQNLLSMQYSTAALRMLAIEDVLSGPDHQHRELGSKMAQLKDLRTQYTDGQDAADAENYPPPRRRAPEMVKDSSTPTNKLNLLTKVMGGFAHQFRPVRPGARKRPQMALPYQDASWFVLVKLDSVLVSAADGTSAAWYQRDPKLFRSLGWQSLRLHLKLRRAWPRLAAQYRAAAPEFTSPRVWRDTFAASTSEPGGPA